MSSARWTLLVALSFAPASFPQEWSRFRGPNGQGTGPEVAITDFSPEAARWKATLPGTGHSSPVIWKTSLVVTAVDVETQTRFVVCHDTATGERRWLHEESVAPHAQHPLNSFASSTPALDELGAYVAWTNGKRLELLALDHQGKERWRRTLGPHAAQHGSGASPIVVDDLVLVANDHESEGEESSLVGLDRSTGKERWRRHRETVRAAYSTPVIRRIGERAEVIFTSSAHGVTALDPHTGDLLWEASELFRERCVGSLALTQTGLAFASAGSGGGGKESVLMRLPGADLEQQPAEIVQRPRRSLPYVPTPIARDDRLFLWNDGGIVSCLALPTLKVLWSERVGGTFYASPIALGDRLLAMNTGGELIVLRAGDAFEELARFEFEAPSHATPAVANGRVFVRTLSTLYAFGP
ncbi:MAG: PQQ-binding-like beta-propeller repeat protein [Planctomycetes bacterium]|nr:PQQ-binding-like beta-propeller repeat protein [Planctomycetota bacterium]